LSNSFKVVPSKIICSLDCFLSLMMVKFILVLSSPNEAKVNDSFVFFFINLS
jgi:hypothetical protein